MVVQGGRLYRPAERLFQQPKQQHKLCIYMKLLLLHIITIRYNTIRYRRSALDDDDHWNTINHHMGGQRDVDPVQSPTEEQQGNLSGRRRRGRRGRVDFKRDCMEGERDPEREGGGIEKKRDRERDPERSREWIQTPDPDAISDTDNIQKGIEYTNIHPSHTCIYIYIYCYSYMYSTIIVCRIRIL